MIAAGALCNPPTGGFFADIDGRRATVGIDEAPSLIPASSEQHPI